MRRTFLIVVAFVIFAPLAACSLTKRTPGTCTSDDECPSDSYCMLEKPMRYKCLKKQPDGGAPPLCSATIPCADGGPSICDVDAGRCIECVRKQDCTGATKPACDLTTKTCVGCTEPGDCSGTPTPACDMDAKTCVECLKKEDCTGTKHACLAKMCVGCLKKEDCGGTTPACDTDAKTCVGCVEPDDCSGSTPVCDMDAKTCVGCLEKKHCGGTKPICDAKSCRGCKTDSECGDPGICLEDGHCATSNEVVYVKNDVAACSDTGTGTAAQPFCSPQPAIAALAPNRSALRLEGPNPLDRAAFSGFAFPVVVVGKNGAVISPGAGKGIFATAGSVVKVRTLTINGGAGSLGAQADTGAELHMDRCLIQNNSIGGILINGASYDIQNTIIASNTFGVTFTATEPPRPSQFRFNTVVGNSGSAVSCDFNSPRTITASIVLGANNFCTLDNTDTTTTALNATRHLTAKVPCPEGPASPPDHDFDGDPRTAPVDCGADQFVP
jgi:hypothetical protein